MTREEARVKLCTTPIMVLEGNVTQYEEALKLAIEALQERPKGRWEEGTCTACKFDITCLTDGENDLEQWVWDKGFDFCPNCGADCRESEE